MTPDPDRPEKLLSVADEIEATAIVGYLEEFGIKAFAAGGYTSGFKAEAPGLISVLVKQADLDRARQALAEHEIYRDTTDWSEVEVAEQEEAEPPAGEASDAEGNRRAAANQTLLVFELLGIVLCLILLLTQKMSALPFTILVIVFAVLVFLLASGSFLRR